MMITWPGSLTFWCKGGWKITIRLDDPDYGGVLDQVLAELEGWA